MPIGPHLTLLNWLLALLPIVVLLIGMLFLHWSAAKIGVVCWLVAVAVAYWIFGADTFLITLATTKGLSLSLFVLTIVWTSVYLFNLIERQGGIHIIGRTMTHLTRDPLAQALLVGWAFAGFTQGVTGFGVPVALVAPMMVLMGFHPVKAVAIVLVGHSWAVTFGSLGSSFYTIQLVTGIPPGVIGPNMAMLFVVPIVATGFAVAHIQGGWASFRRGAPAIVITGLSMALMQWVMAYLGAGQIAAVVAGLAGCVVTWLIIQTPLLRSGSSLVDIQAEPNNTSSKPRQDMGFHMAFLPYYLLIALSVLSQIPPVRTATAGWFWGMDYPGGETALGFVIEPITNYASIHFVSHPAPVILVATAFTFLVYRTTGLWRRREGVEALRRTYRQCVTPTLGIATLVMMAVVIADTGMTTMLANGIAVTTGHLFPVFSPFIGLLGTFVTGSNTNSNVMFGALQMETAMALGIGTVAIASTQSIGGSLGSAIAPAKMLVGTTIVGLAGREGSVMRRIIPYCAVIVLLVGIQAWVAVYVFGAK